MYQCNVRDNVRDKNSDGNKIQGTIQWSVMGSQTIHSHQSYTFRMICLYWFLVCLFYSVNCIASRRQTGAHLALRLHNAVYNLLNKIVGIRRTFNISLLYKLIQNI